MLGLPLEYVIFAGLMILVAARPDRALTSASIAVAALIAYKLAVTGLELGPGLAGLFAHLGHEAVPLANLGLLIIGFSALATHLELSRLPERLGRLLPADGRGPFVLLAVVFAISTFVDNIAAALLGGVMARKATGGPLAVPYIVALVAAANAGGAGSVIGDTTTTLMWVRGVPALDILPAFVGAIVALLVSGVPAARAQHSLSWVGNRGAWENAIKVPLLARHIWVVGLSLLAVAATTTALNIFAPALLARLPWAGLALWLILLLARAANFDGQLLSPASLRSAGLLCLLVLAASLLPIESLPRPSILTVAGLGAVSSLVDNIPLTALALNQGGYDWGLVAYAVGFGGSMLWFGSSAGVALTELHPQARPLRAWVAGAKYVALGYALGFIAMVLLTGWHPRAL